MSTEIRSGEPGSQHPGIGALVRIGWIAVGFVSLVMMTMSIANHPTWAFGWRDGVFWGLAAITGALRYLDVTRFGGETANGAPATARDLRTYLVGLVLAASAAWVVAHSVDF
jgi:hypothetical protein